jgi:hypothetical protein
MEDSRMKTLAQILCLIALSSAFSACASNDIRWTEEVKLSDGRVIQIQRHVELTESGFPMQRRGLDRYQEICYPPMNIHWKAKAGFKPDIFDIVDGRAYMHVPLGACAECSAHDYPSPNALYFVWDNGKWRRIRYEEFPETSEWNLLMQTKGGSKETDPQGLITIEDKTTGKWTDSTLRLDQKRSGWRRVNEDYYWRDACRKCGPSGPNATSAVTDIFINDGKNSCQP